MGVCTHNALTSGSTEKSSMRGLNQRPIHRTLPTCNEFVSISPTCLWTNTKESIPTPCIQTKKPTRLRSVAESDNCISACISKACERNFLTILVISSTRSLISSCNTKQIQKWWNWKNEKEFFKYFWTVSNVVSQRVHFQRDYIS